MPGAGKTSKTHVDALRQHLTGGWIVEREQKPVGLLAQSQLGLEDRHTLRVAGDGEGHRNQRDVGAVAVFVGGGDAQLELGAVAFGAG